jgi:hypothetical protein
MFIINEHAFSSFNVNFPTLQLVAFAKETNSNGVSGFHYFQMGTEFYRIVILECSIFLNTAWF